MRRALGIIIAALSLAYAVATPARAVENGYTVNEIVDEGHRFFGATSGGLASVIEKAFQQYGLPNGYILGEEASGAFIGGLRFGEGTLFTKNAGEHRVFWQGPSLGLDVGGDGARTMMLVYNLPSVEAVYGRFGGVTGSAYLVGGVGMTMLKLNDITIVPVKTGVGARLGFNLGYLKITPMPTWNPF
ncbi:DUF1134 domain-containing protein [Mangrovibrevibacter kandeliae]|uniref:DUF1134 domain-containing protein n=1 Tax=Mangrovibrevibacter kandeliae TaxID=2968473 RepID=UPI002117B0E0|nr:MULTISPECIES: DUF1134 domain-containing protein [unclassified Aurantimonas]MCQ8784181.1 DUF1134 domain-containing protein [Aurantimonas sp. CSK15Z-1]MCQ8784258.1 DUF1134 domain-containing protein [Aurantimonas sp. CSK15Z-1]MCW4116899.1 DUF1134 domain-containing protein [Aurantimonas sp. MSK8Z-1]